MSTENKRILVAEDEKPMAKALQLKLSKSGFAVDAVANGEELLEALKNNQYDLILMDLIMPKMDGFATLETLQKQGNKIPIIVSSNLSQEEDAKRAKDLGAMDFIIKSNTSIADIVAKIENYFNK